MDSAAGGAALTVLADPTRARIVQLIRDADDGRALVGRLADALGLRQPTVSHHMSALHAEGVVIREPDGRRVWYSINPEHADRVLALLGDVRRADSEPEPDLDRVAHDLTSRFEGSIAPETIREYVDDSYRLLSTQERSPHLTSRTASFAAARLQGLERTSGEQAHRPTVLFVCVQNAGRSQLAAGILRQLVGDRVIVRTAGSAPTDDVRSTIVTALDEIGVPLDGEFPKPLTDDAVQAADFVITMGCGDACPIYPGRQYLDWDLDDPVGQPLTVVRRIRDDIEERVRGLLPEILGTALGNQ